MRSSELCPSPHLEAADFDGDTVVTIDRVDFHEVGEEKVTKGVIYFREYKRALVVNKTNRLRIEGHHGLETDDWIGKQVTLYPSETDYGGQTVPCIRVRAK